MNSGSDNSQLIGLIYLICSAVSFIRCVLSLMGGRITIALVHAALGAIFIIVFLIYKKRGS